MTLGERLKHIRMTRGISGNDLAARSGIPQASISNIESGKVPNPGVITTARIAKALGVTIDELIGEVELPNSRAGEPEEVLARVKALEDTVTALLGGMHKSDDPFFSKMVVSKPAEEPKPVQSFSPKGPAKKPRRT